MTRLALTTAFIASLCASSAAAIPPSMEEDSKPTLSLGLSFAIGAQKPVDTGISLRLLSTNELNSAAATAGVTYYIGSGTFGVDAGVAYNFNGNMTSAFTYDFVQKGAVFSLGTANLKKKAEERWLD